MPVRMTHPRLGERHVATKVVEKMRGNGWSVADDPPPRKRRRKADTDKPSETGSGGFFVPENEQET